MSNLAAVFLFSGLFLAFGGIGGMDAVPVWEPNPYFWHQLAAVFVGMFFMFIAVMLMPHQGDSEDA